MDACEMRSEAMRAERAKRLRERDMAAVAQLPDFSPAEGNDAEAGWGGASAYIKPRWGQVVSKLNSFDPMSLKGARFQIVKTCN